MASLEVFSALWCAVEQTAVGLTLCDRRWPLMAAKCGPTVADRHRLQGPFVLSGAESDVLLMVRSKPIRTSESAATFKDPALVSGRPARRALPVKNSSRTIQPG
jgi:hypothetical protein